jgi:DNA-binding response OmpR family regulator
VVAGVSGPGGARAGRDRRPVTQPFATCLARLRVLVVEDEFLIAMTIEQCLQAEGCVVVGPAPSVATALDLIDREPPQAALLDVNLDGELSTPIAERLRAMGIPYLLVTGYADLAQADPVLRHAERMGKPFMPAQLIRRMEQLFC